MERDYKISIIRILAMLSIVACHIFQAYDMEIAFWLNVGVQVFLFMSGYLYGKKNITETYGWLKKQFKKILLPYYVYILPIIIIYLIFARNTLTITNVESILLCIQLILGMPRGLGHLWFIPLILICYLITPTLQKIIKTKEKIGIREVFTLIGILIFIELFLLQSAISIGICNLICYILGYLIAHLSLKQKKEKNIISITIVVLAIISNLIKIFIMPDRYNIIVKLMFKAIIANSHILLGSAIFIIMYKILGNIEKKLNQCMTRIIDCVDKYCFYIYLTHHIFILGPLAIIKLTPISLLNIIIIICCTIISSYVLEKVTCIVKRGLKER